MIAKTTYLNAATGEQLHITKELAKNEYLIIKKSKIYEFDEKNRFIVHWHIYVDKSKNEKTEQLDLFQSRIPEF